MTVGRYRVPSPHPQPYQGSLDDFVQVLALADLTVPTDIYAAQDADDLEAVSKFILYKGYGELPVAAILHNLF